MNKIVAVILSLLFIGITGCGDKKQEGKEKIAVVVSTLNNPWFVVLGDAAAGRASELGYEAVIFDSQNSTAKEADHIDNIIAGGYKAILFNPTDADGSIANVKRAKDANIPTFCMDREISVNDVAVTQILSDNYSGCVKLGQYFVKKMNKKGKYVELLGILGDNNTWNRSKGFHSVVDKYPEIEMVAQQTAEFDRTKAMEVMESLLQTHSNIKAVFCGNDAMAMGAYQAVHAAGLTDDIMIFGFDGAQDVINSIKEKKIQATGMQFPKVMAKTAAEYADKYIKGERKFAQKVPVGVELVSQENIDKYVAYGKKSKP